MATGVTTYDHGDFVQSIGKLIEMEKKNEEIQKLLNTVESSCSLIQEALEIRRSSIISGSYPEANGKCLD